MLTYLISLISIPYIKLLKYTSDIHYSQSIIYNCISAIRVFFQILSVSELNNTYISSYPTSNPPIILSHYIMVKNNDILYYNNVKYINLYFEIFSTQNFKYSSPHKL